MNFTFNLHPFQDVIFCLQSPKKNALFSSVISSEKLETLFNWSSPPMSEAEGKKYLPTPSMISLFFDISQNAYGRRVNLEAPSLLQFSTWVTRMCGFLIQERTDQAQDPGKFVCTTYLNHFFIF